MNLPRMLLNTRLMPLIIRIAIDNRPGCYYNGYGCYFGVPWSYQDLLKPLGIRDSATCITALDPALAICHQLKWPTN